MTSEAAVVVPERNEGKIRTPLDHLVNGTGAGIGWLIFFAMVITVWEVILRYIFNDPTYWVHESTVFLVATIFALGGPIVLAQDRHIRVRIVYDYVPDRVRAWLDVFNDIVTLLFCIGMAYAAFELFTGAIFNPAGELQLERSGTSWNPPYPALTKGMILLAVSVMCLQAVWHVVVALRMVLPTVLTIIADRR